MERLFKLSVKMWESLFGNDPQVFETEYYNWDEEYHNVKIEYYVGKPKKITPGGVSERYSIWYDLIVTGVYIDDEIIYHADDLPESLWSEFEIRIHEDYEKMLPSNGRLVFYGDIIFSYNYNK